ncbi:MULTISPECIES: cache domain-containing sensor histidine kinase [Paenibacillus]|uniref:cache domain-containing sensor histidine kinase n=1 Tax=Paenibacillus TaxID=44249 RepID=UPI0022B9212C|nr:sensor histidine kinase [Paenibacillus caseinilyticus]MCZ8518218.1 sensor histidine kinase [Paenibacillus caseinilyticus]
MEDRIAALLRPLLRKTMIRHVLFSYLGLNLLLLFLLGAVSIRDSSATLTEEVTKASYRVMEQAALGFRFNLEEAKRTLAGFAGHPSVVQMLRAGDRLPVEEKLLHERNISDLAFGVSSFQSLVSDILILGRNGYVNNLDGRKSLRWDYPFGDQPWFKAALSAPQGSGFVTLGLHTQNYYVSSALSRANTSVLSIALPLADGGREPVGAVIANLDLKKINGLFERSSYGNGEQIFMVDANRTVIVHKDSGAIGRTLDFPEIGRIEQGESGSFFSEIDGKEQLVIYQPTGVDGLRLLSTVPMSEIRGQADPLRAKLTGILYGCLLLNALVSILLTVRLSRPFSRLLHTLDSLGEDSLYVVPKNYKYLELNLIGQKFKELVGRIEQLVKMNYSSQIALQEARWKTLQSQIQPHFLFNTLQLLQTEIVCGSAADSNRIILALSSLLRYSMQRSPGTVTLQEELENVRDYLFILAKKYDNRIRFVSHIEDPALLEGRTIKLILQPLVENAILHGFRENPVDAEIHIRVAAVKKGILVTITDNGCGMSWERRRWVGQQLSEEEMESGSIGMRNVDRRIKLSCGPEYGLRVRSTSGGGTRIHVLLPGGAGPVHEKGECVS